MAADTEDADTVTVFARRPPVPDERGRHGTGV
jgi:hypothetical protein